MQQIICRYSKGEPVKWISHLDLIRTLERALRRAGLPLALTQGHNPRLKLTFGPPLAVGVTSEAELLAVHLARPLDPEEVARRVNDQLPAGIGLREAWAVPSHQKRLSFGEIDGAEYLIRAQGEVDPDEAGRLAAELLARTEVEVERGGDRGRRRVDIRPWVLGLRMLDSGEGWVEFSLRVKTGSRGGVRPEEVLKELGLFGRAIRVSCHRTALFTVPAEAGSRPRAGRSWGARRRRPSPRRKEENEKTDHRQRE
jgi:radical SAM-linked protein